MKQTVLFVLLEQFADWEYAFLAAALQGNIQDKQSPYEVKTVSTTTAPIKSIGGITVLPDYDVDNCPKDFAGLVLVGGLSWRTEEAKKIASLAGQAYRDGKVVGAICDATVFLGTQGLLNGRKHTSNTLDDLSATAGDHYTASGLYQKEEAVRDGNLVTANGTGYLEFTREMLLALEAYPTDYVENNYRFFKEGFIAFTRGM